MKLMIATHNAGKKREFLAIISELFFDIELVDFPPDFIVEEDGDSFRENAIKKAHEAVNKFNVVVIADDSGLEVDALDGAPGVYSARFAGEHATDQDNNQKLIQMLHGKTNRKARYVAEVVIAFPSNQKYNLPPGAERRCSVKRGCTAFFVARGTCEGEIIDAPRGENGFGYDPHFLIPEWDQTMAEVSLERKATISHRAKALLELRSIFSKSVF